RSPAIFTEAQTRLADEILHAGFVENRADYVHWLWQADLLPVSARHDFFGVSAVEAIYCGVRPLLPNRLAYSEHVAPEDLYPEGMPLDQVIRQAWAKGQGDMRARRARVASYDWGRMAPRYDAELASLPGITRLPPTGQNPGQS
ncbi:MAG: hypothetical protein AAFV07_06350, partial [Bacteroidota bacterium]